MKEPRHLMGYQAVIDWMGEPTLTLDDVWPESPRAIIVGLNPAPSSVEAGHYYQGSSGRRQLRRLASAGLFAEPEGNEFEDAALLAHVGFTDIVKRPTSGERGVTRDEIRYGREVLVRTLAAKSVPLVVCVFRQPAVALTGAEGRPGVQPGRAEWGGTVFRMPGPFAPAADVVGVMAELSALTRRWVDDAIK